MRRLFLLTLLTLTGLIPALGAAPSATRALPPGVMPGAAVPVALAIDAPAASSIEITERVPAGWRVSEISDGGRADGDTVTWLRESSDAPRVVSYLLEVPAEAGSSGHFSGEVILRSPDSSLTLSIGGDTRLEVGRAVTVWGFDINTWELLGIVATFVFASRFLVQWIASERRGRSVVPTVFWWLSLLGAAGLLLYGIHFRRLAVVLGQSFGFIVYIRNLTLIARPKKSPSSPRRGEREGN